MITEDIVVHDGPRAVAFTLRPLGRGRWRAEVYLPLVMSDGRLFNEPICCRDGRDRNALRAECVAMGEEMLARLPWAPPEEARRQADPAFDLDDLARGWSDPFDPDEFPEPEGRA
ncbi:MAG TPA: hypothetical protein VD978_07760 [Azospirillum sp.]|nr:hypothetical protein [Azospirillum sp.]